MGFPRQEYWSGLPFHSPRDLLYSGIQSASPALGAYSLPLRLWGSPVQVYVNQMIPRTEEPGEIGHNLATKQQQQYVQITYTYN